MAPLVINLLDVPVLLQFNPLKLAVVPALFLMITPENQSKEQPVVLVALQICALDAPYQLRDPNNSSAVFNLVKLMFIV